MRRALESVVVAVLVTLASWANAQEAEVGAELTDRAAAQQKMISLNLSGEVDLPVFLDYVSKATGKSFVYDQRTFAGKVMLLAPTKIPESNLFILLESLLEYQDYALVPGTGGVIKVVKKADTAARPTPVVLAEELEGLPDSDSMLTVAYKLKYVNTPEIQTALGPLVGASRTTIVVIGRANVILLTDYLSNLRRMVKIIEMIDDERNAPRVEIFDLKYANAEGTRAATGDDRGGAGGDRRGGQRTAVDQARVRHDDQQDNRRVDGCWHRGDDGADKQAGRGAAGLGEHKALSQAQEHEGQGHRRNAATAGTADAVGGEVGTGGRGQGAGRSRRARRSHIAGRFEDSRRREQQHGDCLRAGRRSGGDRGFDKGTRQAQGAGAYRGACGAGRAAGTTATWAWSLQAGATTGWGCRRSVFRRMTMRPG